MILNCLSTTRFFGSIPPIAFQHYFNNGASLASQNVAAAMETYCSSVERALSISAIITELD
jgi:hypothetical protein